MKIISLDQASVGTPHKIIEITAGLDMRKKLLTMGIHVGDFISKLNRARWSPVLIKNLTTRSSKIAISQSLACKIMVGDE
jgi:Fe2+ transport system protein FeoA